MYSPILKQVTDEYHIEAVRSDCLNLYNLERNFQYSDFKKSAEYCRQRLLESGIHNAAIKVLPADGKTTYLDFTMPEAWDIDNAELAMIQADGAEELITCYKDDPFCVANRCAPTPPAGLVVEVIDYNDMIRCTPVFGKYVFAHNVSPMIVRNEAVQRGALGIICDFTKNHDLQQNTWWCNGWCSPGWYHSADDTKIQCFMLPPCKGQRFVDAFAKSEKVTIRAKVNSRIYDGEIYTVTGTIPGASEREILLLSHIYEPFITDNASGASAVIESARILNKLISSGELPRPQKTIRYMIGMEVYGFAENFTHEQKRKNACLAINMDCLNLDVRKLGTNVCFRRSAAPVPFWGDYILQDLITEHLTGYPINFEYNSLSDDSFMSDRTIGVPSVWLYTDANSYQHNSFDQSDKIVDWELGRRNTEIITAFTAIISGAGDTAALSREFALDSKAKISQAAENGSAEKLKFTAATIRRKINNFWEFYNSNPNDELSQIIAELSPGLTDYKLHSELPQTLEREAAANIIVERLSIGFPFSQARVPVNKRIRTMGWLHCQLLNWCDGKNNFLYAVKQYELESGQSVSDSQLLLQIRFLQFLEKYGYLKLSYRRCFTEEDILADLHKLGIKPGDRIMVHSTCSAIGPVVGGVATICQALMRAVGENGTIMMPAFTHSNIEKWNPGRKLVFDPQNTPGRSGAIPEFFRKIPGVTRSINPTHSILAWGDKAEFYTAEHLEGNTMGIDSPLQRLEADSGKILLIACPRANTFHHVVETTIGSHCTSEGPDVLPMKMPDGTIENYPAWVWRDGKCPHTDNAEYLNDMKNNNTIIQGRIGFAETLLFTMHDCRNVIEKRLKGPQGCSDCLRRPLPTFPADN